MKIVITEHQYEKLLLESSKSMISDEIKRSKEFVKKISFQSKQSFDESLIDENEVISLE